jgi:hypothetical protein
MTLHKIAWAVVIPCGVWAMWVTASLPQYWRFPNGTALSSYGSRPQAVAPVPASIAIAEAR